MQELADKYLKYLNIPKQTRSDHVKLLKSFLSSFEANFGECVLIFALLRNPVFLNALNYIKQMFDKSEIKIKDNLMYLYNLSEEHLKCAILSCIAEFSSTQELLALGYDLTNDQLKYAKKRAKKNIYQVLSNDNEDCEKLQKKLNDQQIQMIENVILPFTTEQQANSKSPTIPSAHIMSDINDMKIEQKNDLSNNETAINKIILYDGQVRLRFNSISFLYAAVLKKCGPIISLPSFRRITSNIQKPKSRIDECERCVRLEYLQRKRSFVRLDKRERLEVKILLEHQKQAQIQRDAYNLLIHNVQENEIVLVMDFGEDFHGPYEQTQTGSTHFNHQNITILNITAFSNTDVTSYNFISETVNHDSQFVIENLNNLLQKNIFNDINKITFVSDNGPHFKKRHGKAKCDSEIGEIKTSLYQNLPANGIENIEKLQEALIENTKRCSNKKEFIIHKDQEQFIGKTIQVKNIKSYLFFKRESEIADVQALHTFESSNSTKINMTEKEISKKDRKHSSRKQTVPQTSTPPKVMNIIESRIQKDNNDQNDEDDEDDDMQHSQTDQQQELEPIRIVKRKRRRIELDSDEDEEENIYQNDEQYDEFEEMVPSDQFGEDEDQELIALKSAFKKNGRNKQKKY